MKAFFVLGIFLAATLAGCISNEEPEPTSGVQPKRKLGPVAPETYLSKLSQPLFDIILKENVKVASFDGKKMDNWVYRPKVDDGTKVPVFINFSPYWSNSAAAAEVMGDNFAKYMIQEYVPRGYAVVLSSLRGTGFSEGCFNIGGMVEQRDALAVIDHFAKQPWSSGAVGAGGKSYDGTTPQGAAIHAPEALKMIFPVSAISELYKYNYKGGIPFGNGAEFNTRYFATMSTPQTYQGNPALVAEDAACPYAPEVIGQGVASAATGDYSAYWQERNYSKAAKNVKVPIFFVHGLTDWNVKPDHILPWLNAIPAETPRKVWLHNWTKSPEGGHVYPMREDWNMTMLRFLDQTLKGIETGIFAEPAVQVQDSTGVWRWEETWPPVDAVPTKFYFANKALATAPGTAASVSFVDNAPAAPGAGAVGGTCRWSPSEAMLRYETTLDKTLHYAGEPIVHMQVKSDRPVGKVIVTLCALGPSGQFQMINWGGLNLRHRVALENPQVVQPETVYNIRFPLFPQDDVVPAGWKLVAYIAGSGGQYSPAPYGNRLTIQENDKAWIEFPVKTEYQLETPQPVKIPCFAC